MRFTSTRSNCAVSAAQAITRGIADDGGLFVPESFPRLSPDDIAGLCRLDYIGRAARILSLYLTDYTAEEIDHCVRSAYTGTFENDDPAPLREVAPGMNLLELWHGPTCAFKDMALQLLPFLLTTAARKAAPDKTMVILVATSGDTGKAALDGFADVPGTGIVVFFPRDGVSPMQKLQMQTQAGANVAVCAIEGNFDDAQTGVKTIFADPAMKAFLADRNMEFSSANSINFGRLVPQVVYYVSAYCDLLNQGKLKDGETFNVTVPTGNFGNILAAYYAKCMGIPINRFICASNRNNILTDFIATGVYDRNRPFHTTDSPSMDILISSNLERLLYHLCGDHAAVAAEMAALKNDGKYTVPADVLTKLQNEFFGGCCDDAATAATIRTLFEQHHYLCDTHTAVAVNVYQQYLAATGDDRPCVIASTASPYKFARAVLSAVNNGAALPPDEFAMVEELSRLTGTAIPGPIAGLRERPVLHRSSVAKDAMTGFIRDFLQ
ncbi:MAG: threonine synthase [Lentisphaeria bacterium]|nr:threonine synthase [Lentisphaeria bacterium]